MRTKEEILEQINQIMEEYVTPNVAQHGGQVNILDFDMETGVLHTQLSGSCSGCASSTATLKMGIQNTLMHFVKEITEVTGEDDPEYNNPYYQPYSSIDMIDMEYRDFDDDGS